MEEILGYLDPKLVTFPDLKTRDPVLEVLVDLFGNQGKLSDKKAFLAKIREREELVSTGIGFGVAIPHAKLPDFGNFFIAIAVLKHPVGWGALDGAPVRLIFMIGGPDDKQNEYLKILSKLTVVIKDEALREKLLQATTPDQVIQILSAK